jgi:hypothetical protein
MILCDRPMLRADALVRMVPAGVEVELDDSVFTVSGAQPERLFHSLELMNGLLDIPAVSTREAALDSWSRLSRC